MSDRSKAQAARIVFGEALMLVEDNPNGDGDPDLSLGYSVSPQKLMSPMSTPRGENNRPPPPRDGDASFSTTGSSVGSTGNDSSLASSSRGRSSGNGGDSSQSKQQHSRRHPVSMGPFDKIIAAESETKQDKENDDNPMFDTSTDTTKSASSSPSSPHAKTPGRPVRSPQAAQQRRDMVRQTQRAVDQASRSLGPATSVNPSIHRARRAKVEHDCHTSKQTAQYKAELQEEREAAQAFHQQAEHSRRKLLDLKRGLASQMGQEKARRESNRRQQVMDEVDRESQFKSSVYRDHQATLRQQEDQQRRKSTAARARLRQNHRQGEERLQLQRIDEDQAILEERYGASIAIRETARQNAENRRRSFCFRNGDARRIRELHAAMEVEQLHREHDSYELNWEGERDAQAYRDRLQEDRRLSLAARGRSLVEQRDQERTRQEQERAAEHAGYELEWDGERDADDYRRQLEKQRRESLAFRNREGHRQRQEAADRASEELATEHQSYELKWAGEKDAEAYTRKMEQERRKSLAFRNAEAKRRRDLEAQQRGEQLVGEHQSYELKFAGESDADAYKRQMEEERRLSLEGRNQYAYQQRQQQGQHESELREQEHASYELKWAGEKDAEQYRRDLDRERRESLERRNQERAHHAKVMDELKMLAREQETESLVLKWAGEEDAKSYLHTLEEERRQSLQLRGKQVLHHREVESEQGDEELRQQQEDEEWRSGAQTDVEAYKEECAARDRASLQYRRKEAHLQRLEEEERMQDQRQLDSANFQLETLARTDVGEYIQGCKQRRRLSLAFRAKEKSRHADWRREQSEKERERTSRQVRDRLLDRRYVELAQHQERAEQAMDAIRHAQCSFNPFGGVM